MKDQMNKFQKWARDNYKPMDPVDDMWHPEIQAECLVMRNEYKLAEEKRQQEERAAMAEVTVAAETKNLDFLRQGFVIIAAEFGGTIAKKRPMTRQEIEKTLLGMTPEQREKAKQDIEGMEKRLFAKSGFRELENLMSETSKLRERFKMLGQPFASGQTIMKVGTLKKFVAMKDEIKSARKVLVDALVASWPMATGQMVVDSQFWDPNDYRPAEAIPAMFSFKTTILGFVSEELLKEQVGEAALKAEQEDMVNALAEVKRDGIALMRESIAELVSGLAESLTQGPSGEKKKFHASSVTKIIEYLETYNDRDLWGDGALQTEVEKLRKMVTGIDVDKLSAGKQGDEALRERVRKQMEAARAGLGKLLVGTGARAFRLD